jgi:hypothetical protein
MGKSRYTTTEATAPHFMTCTVVRIHLPQSCTNPAKLLALSTAA